MTGPQHYATAERLLQHAATMLDADVDPQRAAELVQRQIAVVTVTISLRCPLTCGNMTLWPIVTALRAAGAWKSSRTVRRCRLTPPWPDACQP